MEKTGCQLMKKATTKEFWDTVRESDAYREVRELILAIYEEDRWEDGIPVLSYASRMRYYTDGDRSEFQAPYFRRRRYMASTALLALIYPDNKGYVEELQEIIWAICEEYAWALPAHCAGNDTDPTVLDLFDAETGFTLAEIQHFLGDVLGERVVSRIKMELKKRIVDPYNGSVHGWEKCGMNWAAVCAGNVGGTLMYLFPEDFEKNKSRLIDSMDNFIQFFPKDGTCLEGPGYWHYGFGNFVWFADLLYQYTNGDIDLFEKEKISEIAGYMQRSFLKGGAIVTSSDASIGTKADKGLQCFLSKRFPEKVTPLPPESYTYYRGNLLWMQFFRSIYYLDKVQADATPQWRDYYLPTARQAIINRRAYSVAAKAGCNLEPHNHNDIGTFILATERGQVICDIGAGEYTREYFDKMRYEHFCTSSRGHNVPIINGLYQSDGGQYNGQLRCADGVIEIDFATAYDMQQLKKLTRTITCGEDKVVLTDTFAVPYDTFTERFVSFFKPEIAEDAVRVADVAIRYDREKCKAIIREEQFKPHVGPAKTVYCIDFILEKGLSEIAFTFAV